MRGPIDDTFVNRALESEYRAAEVADVVNPRIKVASACRAANSWR